MIDDVLTIDDGRRARRVQLADYLDARAEAAAVASEYRWIKTLRQLDVDGQPLRRRFTFRGDSLWWFAELYLHKQQVVLNVYRTIAALDALVSRERPVELAVVRGGPVSRALAPQAAHAHGFRYRAATETPAAASLRILKMDVRARALMLAARLSRARPAQASRQPPATVAAFVHRAFWRSGAPEGSAESYIGPVLEALEARARDRVRYVSLGPAENFRARRWWHAATKRVDPGAAIPIEALAPLSRLVDSNRLWRERHAMLRALWNSHAVREHARVGPYDAWPLIREELAGVVLLQWTWSARAMDEAGAALDAIRPRVAVTYAEAGGWGRALILEARRRGIPTAGLQHGFIYHSWLNYLHEEDEMRSDPTNPSEAGFPRPVHTMLFDEYARTHLERSGHFPPDSLVVTGSPRLDALVRAIDALSSEDIAAARQTTGAGARDVVLFVGKFTQARHVLGPLTDAIGRMPGVHLVIKTHPAETASAYQPVAKGHDNVRVLDAGAPLGPLLRACRLVVTVNSTVALDAGVLGIPALVIGLPNNLSPFVDAGIMAGAATASEIEPALNRILYDEGFRLQIERAREDYLRRFAIGSDGRAAARSAEAVLALAAHDRLESAAITADGRGERDTH
jgi:hypothetical protein